MFAKAVEYKSVSQLDLGSTSSKELIQKQKRSMCYITTAF